MILEHAQHFFEEWVQSPSEEFITLAQSGSARVNFLAKVNSKKYIVTYNENKRENETFFYFSEIFSRLQLNTPKVYSVSQDQTLYIQEFLGEKTLSEVISKEGLSPNVEQLVAQSLVKLYQMQMQTEGKINYQKTFEYEKYDELPIIHDLYYFKNFIVDVLDMEYHKSALLKEFKKLAEYIENIHPKGLMIRDFQSRNIMVNEDNNVYFIDYQSAMQGPLMYDVISFLYQAKANFPETFKEKMLLFYINQFQDKETKNALKNSVEAIQCIRYLQVLGAYGLRGLVQRKQHFLESISKGIENATIFVENWKKMEDFPELKIVIQKLKSEETKQKINTFLNL